MTRRKVAPANKEEGLTKEKAEVYRVFGDTVSKFILAMTVALVFIIASLKLVVDPSWPIAAADMVLGGVVLVVFKHYFPAKEDKPRTRRKPQE